MATSIKYPCDDLCEDFREAKRIEQEESPNDPEEEPYRSRYKARQKYSEIREKLKGYVNENDDVNLTCLLSVSNLYLAKNYVETEELQSGEEHLMVSLNLLKDRKAEKETVNVYQSILNELGILWSKRKDHEKSLEYLQEAENLYESYKHDVGNDPFSVKEYFQPELYEEKGEVEVSHSRTKHFESTFTHTLFYIAQVYALTEEKEKAAKYCHVTLERQLEYNAYKADEWALHAATLSQFYMTEESFTESRHCLASASLIFEEALSRESEMTDDEKEDIKQKKADIQRCWAKYGLALLEASKEFLLKEMGDGATPQVTENHNADVHRDGENSKTSDNQESTNLTTPDESAKTFPRFNLEVTRHEDQITDKLVKDFSEARGVFLSVQTWLNEAKSFYVVDGYCSDYIQITQDYSQLFKELAFFELDMERQCKMHKRRVDILKDTLDDLNPQHYLLVCRQLMYELAETYSSMVDLKLALLESGSRGPNFQAARKINTLIHQSIGQYDHYLTSLKGGKPDYPEEFDGNDLRPALVAMFCVGRLYSKIIAPEPLQRATMLWKSVEHYQFIDTYCKRHPSAESVMSTELAICKEMVELLPLKIQKIRTDQLS